jgi:SAM-dependent methyltransferase
MTAESDMELTNRISSDPLEGSVPEYYSRNPVVRWLFRRRLDCALDFLMQVRCFSLVDLGCGDGSFIRLVLNRNLQVSDLHAIDVHRDVVGLNDTLKGCRFSCQSIERTNFADGQFTAAVCLDVLEHFPDLGPPLAEIRRILGAGGCLVISEPTESKLYKSLRFLLKGYFSKQDEASIDYHFHNAAGVRDAVLRAGFMLSRQRRIPLPTPFDLFHLSLFEKV